MICFTETRNSGTTRESNPGSRARIPTALTTKPLIHTVAYTDSTALTNAVTRGSILGVRAAEIKTYVRFVQTITFARFKYQIATH